MSPWAEILMIHGVKDWGDNSIKILGHASHFYLIGSTYSLMSWPHLMLLSSNNSHPAWRLTVFYIRISTRLEMARNNILDLTTSRIIFAIDTLQRNNQWELVYSQFLDQSYQIFAPEYACVWVSRIDTIWDNMQTAYIVHTSQRLRISTANAGFLTRSPVCFRRSRWLEESLYCSRWSNVWQNSGWLGHWKRNKFLFHAVSVTDIQLGNVASYFFIHIFSSSVKELNSTSDAWFKILHLQWMSCKAKYALYKLSCWLTIIKKLYIWIILVTFCATASLCCSSLNIFLYC